MKINKLRLVNFRNLKEAELDFNSAFKFVVIYGQNGTGKTSILEAISLLNSSKGMLKANLKDIISFEESSFGILANINNDDNLKLEYSNNKKEFYLNSEKLKKLSQVTNMGHICWLMPALDRLFYDSKKPRRDYFDRLVYALDSTLVQKINSYNYIIQSRLKLLLNGSKEGIWIDRLEKDISLLAIDILTSRRNYLEKLNSKLNKVHLYFEHIGNAEKMFEEGLSIENYQQILKSNRNKDIKSASTSFGIHKSDIKGLNTHSNIDLKFASMGQHKRALIDLIIAHIKVIQQKSDLNICLLIDEMTSHLDEKNKQYLFDNLEQLNIQTLFTGVKKEDFELIADKATFIKTT